MAFVVTRLVCPAVTLESHESDSTKPVVPTPAHERVPDQRESPPPRPGRTPTSEPLPEEQPNLVLPWQEVDQEHAQDVREEVDRPDVRTGVRVARREAYTREDRDDLNETVDATKERRLQVREPERGHDDLPLVRQAVRNIVEGREEREEPRLRVQKRLVEPEEEGEMCGYVTWGMYVLLHLEVLVLDTSLVLLYVR